MIRTPTRRRRDEKPNSTRQQNEWKPKQNSYRFICESNEIKVIILDIPGSTFQRQNNYLLFSLSLSLFKQQYCSSSSRSPRCILILFLSLEIKKLTSKFTCFLCCASVPLLTIFTTATKTINERQFLFNSSEKHIKAKVAFRRKNIAREKSII